MKRERAPPGDWFQCPKCRYRCVTREAFEGHLAQHTAEEEGPGLDLRDLGRNRDRLIRAAYYARLSPRPGDPDPDQQLAISRRHGAREGYVEAWAGADVDQSGDVPVWNRPHGERLWALVKGGNVDRIVVWSLSRLSREDPVEQVLLLRTLDNYGVFFESITEPFLNSDQREKNPMYEWLVFGLADRNSAFLADVRRNTRRALRHKQRQGVAVGRHPNLCGVPVEQGGAGPCTTGAHDSQGRTTRPKRVRPKRPRKRSPTTHPPRLYEAGGPIPDKRDGGS